MNIPLLRSMLEKCLKASLLHPMEAYLQKKIEVTVGGIRSADHATPSIR
jgi:uncharacterized protein (DUF2164 family)